MPQRRIDPNVVGASALVIAFTAWLFWPSALSNVRNLNSRGSAVIAFGDSLTAGYGAAAGADYPSRLGEKLNVSIINAGVSGDTTEAALNRIDEDVLQHDPKIVIVGLGGNDFLRGVPIATTEKNLREIVQRVQGAGAACLLLGFTFPSMKADYAGMYERVAEEEGCLLAPKMLRGILTDSKLRSDPIHPNAAGYQLIAERLEKPLGKMLQR